MDIQIIDFHIKYQGDDVILYGRNKENKSVKIVVSNYKPYFYIKCNDNIKNKKSNIKKIQTDKRKPIYKIEECNKYIFSEFNEYKKIDVYKIIVKLSNFKSFKSVDVNDKYEQLEIYYDYCKQFNTNVDLYDNNNGNNNNYNNTISTYVDVYENKIDPILKFYHNKNIKPCGWIRIPKDTKYYSNQYYIDYKNIESIECNDSTKFIIMAYDIECESSNGDFPLAKKEYILLIDKIKNEYKKDKNYNILNKIKSFFQKEVKFKKKNRYR